MSLLYGFARRRSRSPARRPRSAARRSRASPRRRSPAYYRQLELAKASMPSNPCHGLNEYQCGSNANCSYDTNPWTKQKFCKRRKNAYNGLAYEGPMNNPVQSASVAAQDAAAIKQAALDYSAKVAAMGATPAVAAEAAKTAFRSRRVKKVLKRSKKASKKRSRRSKKARCSSCKKSRCSCKKASKKRSRRSKKAKRSRRH